MEVSKMKKEELLHYVQQLQQAAAAAEAAAAAAEQRAEQAEAAAAAAKVKTHAAAAKAKTHAELLESDPAYLAGAIWHHVQHLNLSTLEEGALNALVTHALKGGKLMSAGASRQTLSRARRAVLGYLAEQRLAEAHDTVFDCLYCVPCITVSPEGDYMGYSQVLGKSPRRLAESLAAAEDKDKAKAQLDAAEKEFSAWLEATKAAIAAAASKSSPDNAENA